MLDFVDIIYDCSTSQPPLPTPTTSLPTSPFREASRTPFSLAGQLSTLTSQMDGLTIRSHLRDEKQQQQQQLNLLVTTSFDERWTRRDYVRWDNLHQAPPPSTKERK